MWNRTKKEPVAEFLLLVLLIWIAAFSGLKILQPFSIAFEADGRITAGYVAYALIGIVLTTPAPFLAMLILSRKEEQIRLKEFFRRIFHTENLPLTIALLAVFCIPAAGYAVLCGSRTADPWYMMPVGFLLMIPFTGIAEETGWRGFLQPALEKRMSFPFSVLITAAVWCVWHVDQWFDPTSHHYGDSFAGFAVNILIWSLSLAVLYRATGSVIACAVYHAFIDAIGAVYDWNALFDSFPGTAGAFTYRILIVLISLTVLWMTQRKKKALQG